MLSSATRRRRTQSVRHSLLTLILVAGKRPLIFCQVRGWLLKKFEGAKRDTNWQYDCANAFLDGALSVR